MQNVQNYTDHLFKMRASVQHWLYSSLVYASSLFVGVDQAQSLHNPDTQLPRENAVFPLPQQLADLTLAEVEDLVPVIALVLIPIFGPLGLLRYPTKPVSMAVHVATVSIFTYLQGRPPMDYEHVVRDLLSGEVPQVYTTIQTEQQAEVNMMGVFRARTRKATVLPREYGPVNWYNAPVDLQGQPFRFSWCSDVLRKIKMINASLRASPNVQSNYHFKFIQVPTRYWKASVGYPRARPLARGQEHLDHQLQHLDFARVNRLSRRMAPLQYDPVRRPQGKMTTSGDMPQVLLDMMNSILGGESRAEWEEESLNLNVGNFEVWKRACRLWKQTGWVSKHVALAAACRAEIERAHRNAPQHRNQLLRQPWPCPWNNR